METKCPRKAAICRLETEAVRYAAAVLRVVPSTNRDNEDHSTMLTRELLACRRQGGVPNRDKFKPWGRTPVFGELQWVSIAGCREDPAAGISRLSITSNSSFFFLSLFSMNSNQDLCLELDCGLSGLAFRPGGSGAVQSMRLPLRSLLCLSFAELPVAPPGPPFLSLPILNGYNLTMVEGFQAPRIRKERLLVGAQTGTRNSAVRTEVLVFFGRNKKEVLKRELLQASKLGTCWWKEHARTARADEKGNTQ